MYCISYVTTIINVVVLNFGMKIILIRLLFISISLAHSPKNLTLWTGNDFLEQYPFEKSYDEMNEKERSAYHNWMPYLIGFLGGSFVSINQAMITSKCDSSDLKEYDLLTPIIDMTIDQKFKIIKKWCDDNPSKTHLGMEFVMHNAFRKFSNIK